VARSEQVTHWAFARAIQQLWNQLRAQARLLPARAWWRWSTWLVVGLVGCVALSWAQALVGQRLAPRGLDDWDARVVRWLEQRGPISFQNAILVESPGNLAYLIPLVATAAVIAILKRRPVFAATLVASYLLVRVIVLVGWLTWDRPRPKIILDGVAAPPLHSFPSGHVALALSVYGLLAYVWWERSRSAIERTFIVILTLAWCLVVGTARVRLGTHWPSDVAGGAVLGLAWLPFAIAALRRAERLRDI